MHRLPLLLLFSASPFALGATPLPVPADRAALVRNLGAEMRRLDGVTIPLTRANRPESWEATVSRLATEAESAATLPAFQLTLKRLDAAYPNLHSYYEPGPELEESEPGSIRLAVRFDTEWLALDRTRFVISRVDPDFAGASDTRPAEGDELVAINGHAITEWADENFLFCKFALRGQCDNVLADNFYGQLLSWQQGQAVTYTVRRGTLTWTVAVPEAPRASKPKDVRRFECARQNDRYPGFKLSYAGNRLCVFESDTDPQTAVLRITSFSYKKLADEQPLRTLSQEIKTALPWWQAHAHWEHLLIDVINNGGGNAPIPYYRMLLQEPFQEEYVQFRKTPELDDPALRNGLFWDTASLEVWFQKLVTLGGYAALAPGDWLPPVPQFCNAEDTESCAEGGLYTPYEHPFRGRVSVLTDQYCVSSCDGFAWQLKDRLGLRADFHGAPQAADPAYSRLTIDVFGPTDLKVRPISAPPAEGERLFSQTVYVTRSTDAHGTVIDSKSVPIDHFVPVTLDNIDHWARDVFLEALGSR